MSDHAEVVAALKAYAEAPVTAPAELDAEPADVFGSPPVSTVLQYAQTLRTHAALNDLLAGVAPYIRAADPFRGSVVAITCGSLVESGGEVDLVAGPLLAALPERLAQARRAHESGDASALFAEDPDALKAVKGLTYLLLATMAVLCRGAVYRQRAAANPEIVEGIEALRGAHREADFVSQVLSFTDGAEILVLAPEEQKGFRVALEAVNVNFHLFTLLQAALIGGGHVPGEAPDPDVVAVATGEAPHGRVLGDHARMHFYTWRGLNPDGTLATALESWISGETRPRDVPKLDGERIVLIGPPLLGLRAWESTFFANIHDALRSRAEVVEVLSAEEVEKWIARIKREPR